MIAQRGRREKAFSPSSLLHLQRLREKPSRSNMMLVVGLLTSIGNFTTWNSDGTSLEMNLDEARKQIAKFIHDNHNVVPPEFVDTCNIVVLGWSVEED